MLQNGNDPFQIDRYHCNLGMPIGPVRFIDKIGSDVGYKTATVYQNTYGCRVKTADVILYLTTKPVGGETDKIEEFICRAKAQESTIPN